MKKIAYLLAVMLFAVLLTLSLSSCGEMGGFEYTLDSDGNAIIEVYTETFLSGRETVSVPSHIDGHLVVEIGDMAFRYSKIGDLIIPEGVRSIGSLIFASADFRGSISIPGSVSYIAVDAFLNNSTFDDAVMQVGGVRSVVETTEFKVSPENENYKSECGVLYTADGRELIKYPNNKDTEAFDIPHGVEIVCVSAFYDADNISTLCISDSVISVGGAAFYGMDGLREVNIGKGLVEMAIDDGGHNPFYESEGIRKITVNEENSAFASFGGNLYTKDMTSLIFYAPMNEAESYVTPDGLTEICKYAFSDVSTLKYLTVGASVKDIGDSTFDVCGSLREVRIADGVETLSRSAFRLCDALEYIYIGSTVSSTDSISWWGESVKEIEVSKNNATLKSEDGNLYTKDGKRLISYARGKGEERFEIPNGVETVGEYAFFSPPKLREVYIPSSVTLIEEDAFRLTSLRRVELESPDGWVRMSDADSNEVEFIDANVLSNPKKCARMFNSRSRNGLEKR